VGTISVVILDSRIARADQGTWAFTDGEDAMAVAGFLNARVGRGEEVAWVADVQLAKGLTEKSLRYLDCLAELADELHGEDEQAE
jgi:hypothetical protein